MDTSEPSGSVSCVRLARETDLARDPGRVICHLPVARPVSTHPQFRPYCREGCDRCHYKQGLDDPQGRCPVEADAASRSVVLKPVHVGKSVLLFSSGGLAGRMVFRGRGWAA
jgi:hypothetical protein